ncbi:STAS domain-containing protein [Kitasatospora sp. NA04385]|uniref:STAS domain-containing protein n=1 Tax=Kitasatospora sp. NA04385 TaxID=2742135 RepID=UPI00158FC92E|nr:STAS domain-containing protein [Kitasatospora sp. NA04385]QKW17984.1 STAS domain-containing protein [Kitasatospora sp. NA04385]
MRTPDLRIETRRTGGTVRCALVGALHQDNERVFARALRDGLRTRPARLSVDLRAVDLFTSSALDTLLRAGDEARALGVALALDSPSRCVRRVLELTRTTPYLVVEDGGAARVRRRSRTRPPGTPRADRGPVGPRDCGAFRRRRG